MACATIEDAGHPGHPPSLIRVFDVSSMGGTQAFVVRTAKTDQTGVPRLIWVFAGRTCHFVGFAMRWLFCYWIKDTCVRYILCRINGTCNTIKKRTKYQDWNESKLHMEFLSWDEQLSVTANDIRLKVNTSTHHYENIPIRIYRKFHLQKLKIFK